MYNILLFSWLNTIFSTFISNSICSSSPIYSPLLLFQSKEMNLGLLSISQTFLSQLTIRMHRYINSLHKIVTIIIFDALSCLSLMMKKGKKLRSEVWFSLSVSNFIWNVWMPKRELNDWFIRSKLKKKKYLCLVMCCSISTIRWNMASLKQTKINNDKTSLNTKYFSLWIW